MTIPSLSLDSQARVDFSATWAQNPGMPALLACPFCRELFSLGEAQSCPHCGLSLVRMDKLPLSEEARREAAERGEWIPPTHRPLHVWYFRRGRGALAALALLGLASFLAPWVSIARPEALTLSGLILAKSYAGWLWGGAVGWFILLPLTLSRRSVAQMIGVRVIACLLAGLTLAEVIVLVALPPAESPYLRAELAWAWGLYASAAVSALALVVALRFGGDATDLRDLPEIDLPTQPGGQEDPVH